MSFPRIRAICVLTVCALCLTSLAAAQQNSTNSRSNAAVNNQDIIRMTRAKFDDATIVKTVQAFDTDLDVSVTALVELKEAGVTQPVIQAMLAKATAAGNAQPVERSSPAATPTKEIPSSRKRRRQTSFRCRMDIPYRTVINRTRRVNQ